jgi:hypothetical protein
VLVLTLELINLLFSNVLSTVVVVVSKSTLSFNIPNSLEFTILLLFY